MNELLVIVRQIVIMFLLMSVGFFIYKKKMIDDHSTYPQKNSAEKKLMTMPDLQHKAQYL